MQQKAFDELKRIFTSKPVLALAEVVNHKSMVPEPGWFNGGRKTFKDWWRAMKLYLRANKVTDADEKIIAVLGRFQGETAGAFSQQKLDKIDGGDNTPSWDAFKAELQLVYSDRMKEADVTLLENFLRKCNMGYTLYPWISLLDTTLETSYKPQT